VGQKVRKREKEAEIQISNRKGFLQGVNPGNSREGRTSYLLSGISCPRLADAKKGLVSWRRVMKDGWERKEVRKADEKED
jgi:hypothetical protein